MDLKDYFEEISGRGVLSTADSSGKVNSAIYAKPHIVDENTVAFIMTDRLSHSNLQSNPHAAYLFLEAGDKVNGKRLFLTKTKEDTNRELIDSLRRRGPSSQSKDDEVVKRFLVYFHVDAILPLIGAGKEIS